MAGKSKQAAKKKAQAQSAKEKAFAAWRVQVVKQYGELSMVCQWVLNHSLARVVY